MKGDVTPEIIMKRVEAASGAKYSVQKEAPRKAEPIAPPRSSYTPVGKVDMAALKRNVPPAPKPAPPSAAKPTPSAASLYGRSAASTSGSAPADAWPEEKPAAKAPQAPPLPAASRPPTLPTTARPAFSAMVSCDELSVYRKYLSLDAEACVQRVPRGCDSPATAT